MRKPHFDDRMKTQIEHRREEEPHLSFQQRTLAEDIGIVTVSPIAVVVGPGHSISQIRTTYRPLSLSHAKS